MMNGRSFFFAALLSFACGLHAGDGFFVQAMPVEENKIKLDGVLAEAVWKNAPKNGNFTLLRHPGKPAEEQTSFQVAASKSGLYFAFEVTDGAIVSNIREFDGAIDWEDAIELFITTDDPIPDDPNVHNCRQLLFNAEGTRADYAHVGGVMEKQWTSDWVVAVRKNENGFTAELFLPYYALNFVNTHVKRFHFNIARENSRKEKRELSVWSPTGRFSDQTHFGTLELPFDDFSAYQWTVADPELKTVPAANGTAQMLSGSLSGKAAAEITLQATARREGTVAAFNRITISVPADSATGFRMPLSVGSSGNYEVTITGRTKDGKVFHRIENLYMDALPFKIALENPLYRKSIFPDQEDKTLRVSIDYQTDDPRLLTGVRTSFTVTDAAGKTVAEAERGQGTVRTFTADASQWQPGKYTVTVRSSGSEGMSGTLSETVSILPPPEKGNIVRLGRDRIVYLNGKPFFPRGFLDGDNSRAKFFAEMSAAGYNVIHFYSLNQMKPEKMRFILDEAQKHNLKVFCYPYCRVSISSFAFRPLKSKVRNPKLTPEAWEWMKEMVNEVKGHPAFLGWYLSDEAKGAEFCAELRKVYQFLRELDPYHPVINLDNTADGCLDKRDGYADIHVLDMYPHPLKSGAWQRSVSSVIHSMKLVDEGVAPRGAWFCPEAFKPPHGGYRSLTYREIRCLVFGSLVNGATGMVPYKIGDPRTKYFHNQKNNGIFETPDMHLGYLKGIGPELKGLESVLLEPERLPVETGSKYIIAMRKKHDGKEFILAVNTMPDEAQITLTGKDLPDGDYKVLGENRTVTVKDGRLNDSFAGYMTHIYISDPAFPDPVDIAALEEEIAKTDAAARAGMKNKQ